MSVERALLLTDVVDSTKLGLALGDAAMAELWARHDRLARDLLPEFGGLEIDKTDGFLLLFDHVDAAAAYAAEYHRRLATLEPPIAARAGLHWGPVILTENRPEDVARGAKPLEVDGLAKPTAARIMSLAMGRQTLLSEAAKLQLTEDAQVVSHGHWRVKGIAEPMEVFEVGDDDSPMKPPPDAEKVYRVVQQGELWVPVKHVPHNLPRERDAFVGRAEALQEVAHRLHEGTALISVLGTGGCGKTRLLIHYGWMWLGDWPGGIWFCDLAEARSLEGIAAVVAGALGLPLSSADPVRQIADALGNRGRCLVVLDNFEQVARLADDTLGVWLDRCPEVQFVATTREVLGLAGESVMPLRPLGTQEAVDLFEARAQASNPRFSVDEQNRAAVTELVALLDQLPLALELAAARVRMMPPEKLLQRMSERFRLLAGRGGRRDRQATLRAAIDWSWNLLSEEEQHGLAQLSAFEGGFTLESAEAVLEVGDAWGADIVQGLLDKSMVRQVDDERFGLLMSVHEYAAEKLEEMGLASGIYERHTELFRAWGSSERQRALVRHGGIELRHQLAAELPNVVCAAERAVHWDDPDPAIDCLVAAFEVFYFKGPAAVALRIADPLLARAELTAVQRARTLEIAARTRWLLGETDTALALLHEAVEVVPHEYLDLEGRLHRHLGDMSLRTARLEDALAHYTTAMQCHEQSGDRQLYAHALRNSGLVFQERGDLDEGGTRLERGLQLSRQVGDVFGEAAATGNLALNSAGVGAHDRAGELYLRALELQKQLGNQRMVAQVMSNLATGLMKRGQYAEAEAYLRDAVQVNRQVGDAVSLGICLGNLGSSRVGQGDETGAEDLFRQALALHQRAGFRYGIPHWLGGLARIAMDRGRLDEALEQVEEACEVAAPFPHVLSQNLLVLGELRIRREEYDQAAAAIERCDALGDVGFQECCLALRSLWSLRVGRIEEAAEQAAAARAVVTKDTDVIALRLLDEVEQALG